jgi:hypothetical protein
MPEACRCIEQDCSLQTEVSCCAGSALLLSLRQTRRHNADVQGVLPRSLLLARVSGRRMAGAQSSLQKHIHQHHVEGAQETKASLMNILQALSHFLLAFCIAVIAAVKM